MRRYVLYLFLTFATCTTEQQIDVRLDKPVVVLNALANPDSTWRVSLSETFNIADNPNNLPSSPPIADAKVTVYDSDGNTIEQLVFTFSPGSHPSYTGKTRPAIGRTYHIVAQAKSNTVSATNSIPAPVSISGYAFDSTAFITRGEDIDLTVSFADPKNEHNFYALKILGDGYQLIDGDTVKYIEDIYYHPTDPNYDKSFTNDGGVVINDELFNGTTYQLAVKCRPMRGNIVTAVRLMLVTVTEDYYNYVVTLSLQDQTRGDPFAQPVQLFTNVSNGAGIFAGYSTSVVNVK